ncbi:2-acylglycerol O-acyltransferase 3 [Boothiomyces sp. JEL0866]|nr:2-acylglycerol O-acyltransferase 3 [Boothiomyces sp. JEL0866]
MTKEPLAKDSPKEPQCKPIKKVGKPKYEAIPEDYPKPTFVEKKLQFISVVMWLSMFIFFLVVVPFTFIYSFITIPWSRYLIVAYYGWMLYDRKGPINGRVVPWIRDFVRYNPIWTPFKAYFPGKLIKTCDLDPNEKYIIGYHPHGVYAIALFANVVFNSAIATVFPGIDIIMNTLPANFWIPIWRDYILSLGSGSCESKSIKRRLLHGKPGTAMIIALGGAEEFKHMTEGTLDLVLLKRKGFAKIALATGSHLVPVIGFGENELFHRITHPAFQPLHKFFKAVLKSAAPLFVGRFGVAIPKRVPLYTVVGRPIPVKRVDHPTEEQINELHQKYVSSIQDLYDEFKDEFHTNRTQELRFVA